MIAACFITVLIGLARMVRMFVGQGGSGTHALHEQVVMVRNPVEAGLRKQSRAGL